MPRDVAQALGFLVGLAVSLWLLIPFLGPTAHADSTGLGSDPERPYAALESKLLQSVNRARGERHLIPLRRDPALDEVARRHSMDMARRGFFSHTNPEGQNPVDRIQRGGIVGFSLAAENVGMTDRADPNREILEGWLHSPVHRKNLLAPAFNQTGIGIAVAPGGTLYYTQLYTTRPRDAKP